MTCSKTNQRWLREYFDDPYVKMTQRDGYRPRASHELLEIQEKNRILCPGMTVADLGAAPDGWSQVISRVIDDRGWLIALDILKMDNTLDIIFIQDDFIEDAVFAWVLEMIGDHPVGLTVSDMAPNIGGARVTDQPRATHLCELAPDLAGRVPRSGGDFLIKIFQGGGFDRYHKQAREMFDKVQMRKPLLLCDRSREQYLPARDLRGKWIEIIDPTAYLLVDGLLCRDG